MRYRAKISKLLTQMRGRYAALRPRRYAAADTTYADYSVISTQPPIFYVKHWMDENFVFATSLDLLFEYLADQRAYFLYSWNWDIASPEKVAIAGVFEKHHCRKYPHHRFVHVCNTMQQEELFLTSGLTAIFCNQNCFVDENIFRPLPSVAKRYDAVYDARLKRYKRHYLASEVERLALIYDYNAIVDESAYVDHVRRQFSHAHFFNHSDGSPYRKLSPSEVNQCLNMCRSGLCLSHVEGAMYASIQYLLCGLPVVSTESKGGRAVFFDDDFVIIVDDSAHAIREGTETLIRRDISADTVRSKTLKRMEAHRRTFIATIQDIYAREGVNRDFRTEWETVYCNKLYKHQSHRETIRRL